MTSGRPTWHRRLAWRLALFGVLQLAAIGLGFFAFSRIERPPMERALEHQLAFVADELVAARDRGEDLAVLARRASTTLQLRLRVEDRSGVAMVSPGADGRRPDLTLVRGRGPSRLVVSFWIPPLDAGVGVALLGMVLGVVGATAWLAARRIVVPLAELARAARQLGRGDLDARSGIRQHDEVGVVAASFDDMVERLQASMRKERELLASISHELRTPLARIRVALDIAAESDAAAIAETIPEIAADLSELERLVDDVLDSARLARSGGRSPELLLRRETTAPAELARAALARFRRGHPDVAVAEDLALELPPVDADPALIRRVLENLLVNAATHGHALNVTLGVARDADGVRFAVSDTGPGIPVADLERVGEPFFRADRSRDRSTGGVGLGLSLSRRIVEAHGGSLEVQSRDPHGAVALVRLPRGTARR